MQGADVLRGFLPESLKIKSAVAAEELIRTIDPKAAAAAEAEKAMRALANPTAAAPANPIAATADYVVQPGDTLWSVARRLQPEGDVRPVVDRLVAERGSSGLAVGEVIHIREAS